MRSQTEGSLADIVEQVRTLGSLKVAKGPGFEADLARQVVVPDLSPAELAEAFEHAVFVGKLRMFDHTVDLGRGGVTNDSISEDVTIFTVV